MTKTKPMTLKAPRPVEKIGQLVRVEVVVAVAVAGKDEKKLASLCVLKNVLLQALFVRCETKMIWKMTISKMMISNCQTSVMTKKKKKKKKKCHAVVTDLVQSQLAANRRVSNRRVGNGHREASVRSLDLQGVVVIG